MKYTPLFVPSILSLIRSFIEISLDCCIDSLFCFSMVSFKFWRADISKKSMQSKATLFDWIEKIEKAERFYVFTGIPKEYDFCIFGDTHHFVLLDSGFWKIVLAGQIEF